MCVGIGCSYYFTMLSHKTLADSDICFFFSQEQHSWSWKWQISRSCDVGHSAWQAVRMRPVLLSSDVPVCYAEYPGLELFVDSCSSLGNFSASCSSLVPVLPWRSIADSSKHRSAKSFIWFALLDWTNRCIMEILIITFFHYGNPIDSVMETAKCLHVTYSDITLTGLASCIRTYHLRFSDQ